MNAVVIPPGRINRYTYAAWLWQLTHTLEFPALGNRKAPRKTRLEFRYETEYDE
jgi:hypothetical protein